MYYVYVLKNNRTSRLYIGYTSNLKRRLNEHQKEKDVRLVYYEAYLEEKPA
jgi:predicted GIY-YIG superfamily endonuclease